MARTTISRKNIYRPSPRWYRTLKTIVYGLFVGTLFTGLLQRFGVSEADVNLISGLVIAFIETLGKVLANGEDYVKTK